MREQKSLNDKVNDIIRRKKEKKDWKPIERISIGS